MNNFQTAGGVIVQSLSNSTSADDADFVAAMPVYFSQLNEAWITAVNIDKTGSSGSYSLHKTDQVNVVKLHNIVWEQMVQYYSYLHILLDYGSTLKIQSGTSFVAPQIAGAVALLAEHFPKSFCRTISR